MKKLIAFTLSEVILTMTIVGVVAAMTIPSLQYQRTKKEYSVKLKKFYSRIENAILDMEIDKNINFKSLTQPDSADTYDWYMTYIDPYLGHQYVDETNGIVYFKEGSSVLNFSSASGGGCSEFLYDVNADKAPNIKGRDRFKFLFCFTDAKRVDWFNSADIYFGTYGQFVNKTRAQLIADCQENGDFCARLLQHDLWNYKSDYPYNP